MYIVQLFTNFGQGADRYGLLNVVAFIFALYISLVLHEIAHGLAALWCGDKTAKLYGRLSLNPMRHFDLFGLLMMLFVGFGWAKPVPVDGRNFKNHKVGCIAVSVAGVLTNFLLAFIFAMAYVLLQSVQVQTQNQYYVLYFFAILCQLTMSLNVSFALFNLLPLYPLDGYRFISCFVPQENKFLTFLRKYSMYIMLVMIVLDYIPFVSHFSPFNLYIQQLGGLILDGFEGFWRLIFRG